MELERRMIRRLMLLARGALIPMEKAKMVSAVLFVVLLPSWHSSSSVW